MTLPQLPQRHAGQLGERAAAQALEKPTGKGNEEYQRHVTEGFLLAFGINEPFELKAFKRCKKGNSGGKAHKQDDLCPVLPEIVVDSRLHE